MLNTPHTRSDIKARTTEHQPGEHQSDDVPNGLDDRCPVVCRAAANRRLSLLARRPDRRAVAKAGRPAGPQEGPHAAAVPVAGGGVSHARRHAALTSFPDLPALAKHLRDGAADEEVRPALRLQRHGQDAAVHRVQGPRQDVDATARPRSATRSTSTRTPKTCSRGTTIWRTTSERMLKLNDDSRFFAGCASWRWTTDPPAARPLRRLRFRIDYDRRGGEASRDARTCFDRT